MPTIDSLTERAAPITPDMPVAEVFDLFRKDPDALVFAVVEDDRPVGLVERQTFLVELAGRNGCAERAKTPIRELMDAEPVTIEACTGMRLLRIPCWARGPRACCAASSSRTGPSYVGVEHHAVPAPGHQRLGPAQAGSRRRRGPTGRPGEDGQRAAAHARSNSWPC